MRKLQEAEVKGKNVLVRIDTDAPLKQAADNSRQTATIDNDRRIRASLPTLKYLLDNGAKITIIGHVGRPEGKVVDELKMRPVEDRLIELLGLHQNWQILENLRFNKGEEENDPEFAKQLAAGQDLFIQDAFATCHRKHASTSGVAELLPSYAGLSVQKEVEKLSLLFNKIEKPYTIILGGAKIADKLPTLKNLISKADNFLIGGAIANTFLSARRHFMGKSLVEAESLREANIIWQNLMDDSHKNLYLPRDLLISKSIKEPIDCILVGVDKLLTPDNYQDYSAVDIGRQTIETFKEVIKNSKTIFWNGGMGIAEVVEFSEATKAIAKAVIKIAKDNKDVSVIIGGGDTVSSIESFGLEIPDNVFLSTGGGATLEYLAGKELPGLKALE